MMLPLIGLTASQFIASSVVLSVMTGLDYSAAVIVVSIIVTIYAILGGLWSVTLTDFIQAFLIVFGMAAAIPYALSAVGGWDQVVATLPPEQFSFTGGIGWKTIIALVVMYTASFTVGQEAVSRYYAARDDKAAVQGSILAAIINFVYAFIPAVLGLIALSLVTQGIINADQIMTHGARYALPVLAIQTMPPILVGLLFSGIISATMSSADSDLLGAGSIFGNDIYRVYLKKDATDRQVLITTRIAMAVVGLGAMIIALTNKGNIISLLMFSFTLRAGGSFIPYVVGHYWKKASMQGALASLIMGSIGVLLVERKIIPFFNFDPIYLGLILSLISFLIFTYLYPNKRDTTELVDEVYNR